MGGSEVGDRKLGEGWGNDWGLGNSAGRAMRKREGGRWEVRGRR